MVEYEITRLGAIKPKQTKNCIVFFVPLHSWAEKTCELKPGGRMAIELGIKLELPDGVGLLITNLPKNPRSYGLVVDTQIISNSDEIIISLHSTNKDHEIYISEGDKIAIGSFISLQSHDLIKMEKE